jgi:type IV pilus assembly protein PilY1
MFGSRSVVGFQAALLALAAAASSPAEAQFNVAQYPLFVQQPVKPGFIMAVDDSGSMTFETLFSARDGQACTATDTAGFNAFYDAQGNLRTAAGTGGECLFHHVIPYPGHRIGNNRWAIPPIPQFGFARSPEINPSYYDPATEYRPWKTSTGTEYAPASVTATRTDPRNATPTLNVSALHRDRTDPEGEDGTFSAAYGTTTYNIGTVIPAGLQYNRSGSCGGLASTGGSWVTLVNDHVLTANCSSLQIRRPLTGTPASATTNPFHNELFRIPSGTVLPAGTVYFATANCGGLGGTELTRNHWIRLQNPHLMTARCELGIEYYPATYFLSVNTPAPAGFIVGNRTLAENACGAGCNMFRYEIRPENYSTPAAYTQQIQNFANWFSFYGNRNRAMIAGMTRALADVEFMRVGYFTINNRNTVSMNDMEISSARETLYNQLLSLPASGGTPNRQAVEHIGEQFKRAPAAVNAVNPPQPVLNEANGGACQVNGGMLFTDGYSNQNGPGVGNIDGGMGFPFADGHGDTLADIATKYYLNSVQPGMNQTAIQVPASCANGTAEPWIDCQTFPHMNFYGVTLGSKGDAYGVTHALPPNTWREGYTNPPAWPPRENDSPSTVDDIWHAAINTRGRFINARTPEQITQAMRDVLLDVTSRARPAGGVSASGSRIGQGFLVYVPEFFSDDWTGDVKAYRLSSSGTLQTPHVWSAAEKLNSVSQASRQIFASIGSGSSFSLVPFTTSGLGGQASAQSRLGISASELAAYGSGITMDHIISYLRGDKSQEQSNGGPLRSRRWKIGDILNSQPQLTVAGSFGYTRLNPSEGGGASGPGSYGEYLQSKRTKPPVLFIGANDGMLHAIDSRTTGGDVLFSIVPNSVLTSLKELPKKGYQHRYFVDGSPLQADVRVGTAWRTFLFAGNGAGGKSVMALDVTNAASGFNPGSDFLWEFQNANLGHVINSPRGALLEGGVHAAVFGNGLNAGDFRARLFVLNAVTGAPIANIQVGTGSAGAPNGLTSAIPVDSDSNGKADIIYGGDMQGNLWKFNISSSGSISVANGGQPLFVATDNSGARQPITGSVDAGLHHLSGQLVVFGTGKYVEVGDNLAGSFAQIQSFYAIWDKNDGSTVSGRSQLQAQSISSSTTSNGTPARTINAAPVDWASKRGWYLDLRVGSSAGEGERVIGRPGIALGNIIFTTYSPVGDICNPGGESRLYILSLTSGTPQLRTDTCSTCGGVTVSQGSPVTNPPIVVQPYDHGGGPGGGGNQDCVANPSQAHCTDPPPAAIPPCQNQVFALLPAGMSSPLLTVDCGRQSWRQIQ